MRKHASLTLVEYPSVVGKLSMLYKILQEIIFTVSSAISIMPCLPDTNIPADEGGWEAERKRE